MDELEETIRDMISETRSETSTLSFEAYDIIESESTDETEIESVLDGLLEAMLLDTDAADPFKDLVDYYFTLNSEAADDYSEIYETTYAED